MPIKRIQNAYYGSRDLTKARRFYEEGLGLGLKFADGDRWLQFSANGQNFAIASEEESVASPMGAAVVFEVDDIDQSERAVVAHGGSIISRRDMGDHGRTVTFTDPDGNVLQLFSRG